MRKLILCTAALALMIVVPALSDIFHDRPDPDATGGINGKVSGGTLQDAVAIEQHAYMFYQGSVNGDTYTFTNLPPGKYDLVLKLDLEFVIIVRAKDAHC